MYEYINNSAYYANIRVDTTLRAVSVEAANKATTQSASTITSKLE